MENKLTGYICIFRSIKKHWIWNNPVKFQWWMDLLLSVNFSVEIKKVNIGFDLFDCGRGQTVKTLLTWSKEWKVSKDTTRNFLKLLQKDSMITIENLGKCTRITICNFDNYQNIIHDNSLKSKRKANAKQTQSDPNNNDNNEEQCKQSNWRLDFNIYKSELLAEYKRLINNSEWMDKRQEFNPILNIELSIKKACSEYWATERGWNKKKSSATTHIDWSETFINALSLKSNKVYLQKDE
jgi:hypothetical protein